jgi:osmotically-inducible protein OsmY
MDTWDSRLYDMVLHIRKLTADDAVDILFDTVQKPIFQATAESRRLVDDLALSAKVKANLTKIAPKIEVTADQGKIYIHNVDQVLGSEDEAQVKRIAMQVDGVEQVDFYPSAPKDLHDHINPFHNIA